MSKKKDVRELLESLLCDSAAYRVLNGKRRYPTLDLWLCASSIHDDEEGIYTDGDERAVTRRLNNGWLHPPQNFGWEFPFATHIAEVDRKEVRGMVPLIHKTDDAGLSMQGHKMLRGFVPSKVYKFSYFAAAADDQKGRMTWGKERTTWYILQRSNQYYSCAKSGVVVDIRTDACREEGQSLQDYLRYTLLGARFSFQCFSEYRWRVALEFENGKPPISIHTDPETVKEVLSMRTMLEKDAQKRFVTIVRKHRRRVTDYENSTSAEERKKEVDVMRHFRGRVEGLWQGCRLVVTPPVNDIEAMEKVTKKVEEVAEHSRPVIPQAK